MRRLSKLSAAIGDGLVAGFIGTAAMTASSTIEAKLRDRAFSTAPARIDLFHHTVYAVATGVAYEALAAARVRTTAAKAPKRRSASSA